MSNSHLDQRESTWDRGRDCPERVLEPWWREGVRVPSREFVRHPANRPSKPETSETTYCARSAPAHYTEANDDSGYCNQPSR